MDGEGEGEGGAQEKFCCLERVLKPSRDKRTILCAGEPCVFVCPSGGPLHLAPDAIL